MRVFDWIRQTLGPVSIRRLRETEHEILDRLAVIEAKVNELSEQPKPGGWDQVGKLAPLITSGLTLMTAIAYFLGRIESQSYYGRLGLRLDQVAISFEDYLFITAQTLAVLVGSGLGVPMCGLILILVFMRFFQSYPRPFEWGMVLALLLHSITTIALAGSGLGWWSLPIADPILGYIASGSLVLGLLIFTAMKWASQEKAVESEKIASRALQIAFGLIVLITYSTYLYPISEEPSPSQVLLSMVSAGVLGVMYHHILKEARFSLQVSVWGMVILAIMLVWLPAMAGKLADRVLYPADWPSSLTVLTSEEPLELPRECERADNRYYTPVRDTRSGSHDTVIVIPIREPAISPTTTVTNPLQIQIVPWTEILRMEILPQVTITSSQGLSTTMADLYGPCR
jgi:hypothetical protein